MVAVHRFELRDELLDLAVLLLGFVDDVVEAGLAHGGVHDLLLDLGVEGQLSGDLGHDLLLGRTGGRLGLGEQVLDLTVVGLEQLDDIGHGGLLLLGEGTVVVGDDWCRCRRSWSSTMAA